MLLSTTLLILSRQNSRKRDRSGTWRSNDNAYEVSCVEIKTVLLTSFVTIDSVDATEMLDHLLDGNSVVAITTLCQRVDSVRFCVDHVFRSVGIAFDGDNTNPPIASTSLYNLRRLAPTVQGPAPRIQDTLADALLILRGNGYVADNGALRNVVTPATTDEAV